MAFYLTGVTNHPACEQMPNFNFRRAPYSVNSNSSSKDKIYPPKLKHINLIILIYIRKNHEV